jgi:hypothetical protein
LSGGFEYEIKQLEAYQKSTSAWGHENRL